MSDARGGAFLVLAGVGLVGLGLLAFAGFLASRSQTARAKKPRRKSFERGRLTGREEAPATVEAAIEALSRARGGELADARADERRASVSFRRKRGQPCAPLAGLVVGLFESAWAHEVALAAHACAGDGGGLCRYEVAWAASASGARKEGASIPGSGGAPRRSPPARADGG